MYYTSERLDTDRRATSWLLIMLFLSLTLFPVHFHFYHEEGAGHTDAVADHHVDHHKAGDHVTQAHGALDIFDLDHNEGSHTIEPVSDSKMKAASYQLVLAFLIISLVLLSVSPVRALSRRLEDFEQKLSCLHWYNSPPQRGPPAV